VRGPSPARSPLYEAYNAPRYERQKLIREYQDTYSCRLVVMADAIFPYNITPFEETLYDADPNKDLHVLFFTLGGDGETALRLVRQAQSRCKKLVVIVPDQAKSAGTLFALGADQIYMGPTSDLGPIDPQFQLSENSGLVAGKTIIDAVEDAEKRIQKKTRDLPPSRVVVERHHRDIGTTGPGCNRTNGRSVGGGPRVRFRP
jgi:membrane-bound ClpP family serine protease